MTENTKKNTILRLRIDRMPTEIKLADGRYIANVWGRKIAEDGSHLGFGRAKVWNRAGQALMKHIKAAGISEEKPIELDFHGELKEDLQAKKKGTFFLEAKMYTQPGQALPNRDQQHASEAQAGGRDAAHASSQQAKAPREKRDFEVDIVIGDDLGTQTFNRTGDQASVLVGMKKDEWDKLTPAERDVDGNLFRIKFGAEVADHYDAIMKAARVNGYYYDSSEPVIIRAKGTWDRVPGERNTHQGDDARFREFIFNPKEVTVLAGPNLMQTAGEQTEQNKPAAKKTSAAELVR